MTVDRDQLGELLSAYLDGEVTPSQRALVEQTLRKDPSAQQLLQDLQAASAAVASLPRHPAPPQLLSDIGAHLERQQLVAAQAAPHDRAGHSSWTLVFRAAAMLAIVVGAGWWVLSIQQREGTRTATAPPSAESAAPAGSATIMSTTPMLTVEARLASGADVSTLLSNSFEVEPVRLQVATNVAEQETVTRRLKSILSDANVENLAAVKSPMEKKADAFYFEGRPGVNFKDSTSRQVLVRVPPEQANRLVDEIANFSKDARRQVTLQTDVATVHGAKKSQELFQEILPKQAPKESTTLASRGAAPAADSPNLLKTLGEIVGLGPVVNQPMPPRPTAHEEKAEDVAAVEADDGSTASGTRDRSLVARRLERARTAGTAETDLSPTTSSPLITMVIELIRPEATKPPERQPGPPTRN